MYHKVGTDEEQAYQNLSGSSVTTPPMAAWHAWIDPALSKVTCLLVARYGRRSDDSPVIDPFMHH